MTVSNIIVMVLSAVLAFLLLAYAAHKRYQVKVSRRLAAPPDRVWPYLSDPAYLPRWFPGVTECASNGEVKTGVGQRRHIKIDRDHKRIENPGHLNARGCQKRYETQDGIFDLAHLLIGRMG